MIELIYKIVKFLIDYKKWYAEYNTKEGTPKPPPPPPELP